MKQTDSSNLDLSDISPGFCNLWPILLSHSRSNCVWQKVMVDGWQYYGNILSLTAFSSQLLSSHHRTDIGHSLRILMLNCSVSFHLWKCLPCNFQITFSQNILLKFNLFFWSKDWGNCFMPALTNEQNGNFEGKSLSFQFLGNRIQILL